MSPENSPVCGPPFYGDLLTPGQINNVCCDMRGRFRADCGFYLLSGRRLERREQSHVSVSVRWICSAHRRLAPPPGARAQSKPVPGFCTRG